MRVQGTAADTGTPHNGFPGITARVQGVDARHLLVVELDVEHVGVGDNPLATRGLRNDSHRVLTSHRTMIWAGVLPCRAATSASTG